MQVEAIAINRDARSVQPEPRLNAPTTVEQPLSWAAAWLALREALRPFPDAFQATAVLVKRLLDECESHGDPGARSEDHGVTP